MRRINDIRISQVMPIERIWFTQKDAAKYIGVSAETIKRMRLSGKLPSYSFGGTVLVKKADIERLIHRMS